MSNPYNVNFPPAGLRHFRSFPRRTLLGFNATVNKAMRNGAFLLRSWKFLRLVIRVLRELLMLC